jgi:hypothetical protein
LRCADAVVGQITGGRDPRCGACWRGGRVAALARHIGGSTYVYICNFSGSIGVSNQT